MRLIQRGKRLFTTRPARRTVQSFRAIAAASALASSRRVPYVLVSLLWFAGFATDLSAQTNFVGRYEGVAQTVDLQDDPPRHISESDLRIDISQLGTLLSIDYKDNPIFSTLVFHFEVQANGNSFQGDAWRPDANPFTEGRRIEATLIGNLLSGRFFDNGIGFNGDTLPNEFMDDELTTFALLRIPPPPPPPTDDVIRWTDPTGGSFSDSSNWSPQQVPEKSDTRDDVALFDLNNNYTVDINGNRTVERLVVRAGRVDFDGSILTVAATSPTVPSVSIENDGRLNIATGGLRSVHAIIGNAPPFDPANPPTAEVLVANLAQSQWINTGNLAVGGAGKGRLFVANGGLVESGSATIGGPFGGEASVGGDSSLWKTGNLAVGSGGNGNLNIEAGAEVESGSVEVGTTPGSIGEVTVTGVDATDGSSSSWTTNIITVGGPGATGGLNILDGAAVFAAGLIIGDNVGSTGKVVVSGRNAGGIGLESRLVVATGIVVGGNGDLAQMFVTDGGIVSSNLFMNIEQDGLLEIAGPTSLVDVTGDVNVGTNISGLIQFNGGNMIVGGLLHVGAGGSIEGNGTLVAPNRTVEIGGNIDPGLSPGILTFVADVALTATAQVHVEMAGTAAGLFDVLAITGDATLGGTLLLEFIDGFAPRQGDTFAFLDVGGALSGAFASVEVRNLAPGFQFDLRPDAGGLTMVALNDGVFVPEPATLAMLFAGMLATLFRRQIR
ncbi:MAG: PEP-CTERM sorting domain-containing protein [Pirellulales bacterium]